jgi:predicted RNase H-like nuclease (RuvC/YqgF family)
LAARVWDAVRAIATVTENLRTLEKEDARLQAQVAELGRITLELVKDVHAFAGEMKSIEKRLDDKDKLVEAIVALKVREEIDRLKAELPKLLPPAAP